MGSWSGTPTGGRRPSVAAAAAAVATAVSVASVAGAAPMGGGPPAGGASLVAPAVRQATVPDCWGYYGYGVARRFCCWVEEPCGEDCYNPWRLVTEGNCPAGAGGHAVSARQYQWGSGGRNGRDNPFQPCVKEWRQVRECWPKETSRTHKV